MLVSPFIRIPSSTSSPTIQLITEPKIAIRVQLTYQLGLSRQDQLAQLGFVFTEASTSTQLEVII